MRGRKWGKWLGAGWPIAMMLGAMTGTGAMAQQGLSLEKADIARTTSEDMGDLACLVPVDPFELDANVTRVIMDAIGGGAAGILLEGKGAKDTAIKQAKEAAKGLNWLPLSVEVRLGEMKRQQIQQMGEQNDDYAEVGDEIGFRDKKEAANAIFAELLAMLPPDQPYTFKLVLTKRDQGSAFALPGGLIYLPQGLLPSKQDSSQDTRKKTDRVRVMLAHEIAHVLKRHETRQTQIQLVNLADGVTELKKLLEISDFFSKANEKKRDERLGQLAQLLQIGANYSKQQEQQADGCAIRLLMAAKVDPAPGFVAFAEMLKEEEEKRQQQAESEKEAEEDEESDPASDIGDNLLERAGLPFSSKTVTDIFGGDKKKQAPPPNLKTGSHPTYQERVVMAQKVIQFWRQHPPAPLIPLTVKQPDQR